MEVVFSVIGTESIQNDCRKFIGLKFVGVKFICLDFVCLKFIGVKFVGLKFVGLKKANNFASLVVR